MQMQIVIYREEKRRKDTVILRARGKYALIKNENAPPLHRLGSLPRRVASFDASDRGWGLHDNCIPILGAVL